MARWRDSRWGTRGIRAGSIMAAVAVMIAFWALATGAGWVSPQTLPSVPDVADAIGSLTAQGQVSLNLAVTLFRILLSFVLGLILGIPLGAVMWRVPYVSRALRPYLSAAYSVPLVIFYPFLLVVLGLNDWPVVVLTAVMTTIPICLNTHVGLGSARPVLVNVGRSLERTPWQIFRQIVLPEAWPEILAGIKLSMVYAVVGVVAMEFVAAQEGLGNRIQYYYETFNVPSMYAFIVLTILLSGACVGLVLAVEALTMHGRS